ncbi:hypothetical protein VIGAN_02269600 [Vigna angularis var. angularis]|uniref:Uncharacterized protein n=1 Tax=Vigna angularis var. angularis TaxID=157739 RepID=A0A0S3RGQ5_PHAAN|nr:hypothetical protein VIGAN_02269600 [Vigna angularis var. angularis]
MRNQSIPNFPKNGNVDSPHYFLVVPVVQMDFAFSFASNLTLLPTPSAIAPTTISLHNRVTKQICHSRNI